MTSKTGSSLSTDQTEVQGWKERRGRLFRGALRGTTPGSEGKGIPSGPFTCWFKPKP